MEERIIAIWESENMTLERTILKTSHAGEYFDSRQRSTLTEVAPKQFARTKPKGIDRQRSMSQRPARGTLLGRGGISRHGRGRESRHAEKVAGEVARHAARTGKRLEHVRIRNKKTTATEVR